MRIGAIEAGGTKFVCGIGSEDGTIEESLSFPTEHPEVTMEHVITYFKDKNVDAIGIGTFGPIDIDPGSPLMDMSQRRRSQGGQTINFLECRKSLPVPCGWDTDVNAAAYGEAKWGAAKGLDSCVYHGRYRGRCRCLFGRQACSRASPSRRRSCADKTTPRRPFCRRLSLSWRLPGRHGVRSCD